MTVQELRNLIEECRNIDRNVILYLDLDTSQFFLIDKRSQEKYLTTTDVKVILGTYVATLKDIDSLMITFLLRHNFS